MNKYQCTILGLLASIPLSINANVTPVTANFENSNPGGVPFEIDKNNNLLPAPLIEYEEYAKSVHYDQGGYWNANSKGQRKKIIKQLDSGNCTSQWGYTYNGYFPYIMPFHPTADTTYFSYNVTENNENTPIFRFKGKFPHTRYYSFDLYDALEGWASNSGGILDRDIKPDVEGENPYQTGTYRYSKSKLREFTVWYVPEGRDIAYKNLQEAYGEENVKLIDSSLKEPLFMIRTYLKDNGFNVTGLDTKAGEGLPQIKTFNPNSITVEEILDSPIECPNADNFDVNKMLQILDTIEDSERAHPDTDYFKEVHFLHAPGGGLFPTIQNSYGAAIIRTEEFGEVVDLSFRLPRTPNTVNGEHFFDDELTDLRYWSLCTGSLKLTNTGRCLSDSQSIVDKDGMVRVIIAPNSLQEFISENLRSVNFLPWDGIYDQLKSNEIKVDTTNWQQNDYGVLIHRHLAGNGNYGYSTVPNRPEGVHNEEVKEFWADKYIGDAAPTGVTCTVEEFKRNLKCN